STRATSRACASCARTTPSDSAGSRSERRTDADPVRGRARVPGRGGGGRQDRAHPPPRRGLRPRRTGGARGRPAAGADPHARQAATAAPGAPARAAAPPRPSARRGGPPGPRLVQPRELPRRGLGSDHGRAAFIHAIAHIELNAVDLAWDAAYRFRGLPPDYYADWVRIADDEARHFLMLRERLRALGHDYGDFDAHNGLWEMCEKTAHDGLARMALVPRVLEARGLDVTPGMIAKLRSLGDDATAGVLEVILREEVAHVA